MDSIYTSFLTNIYSNVDLYLILVIRMLGFLIIMPILGGQNIPMMTKIGLSLTVAAILITTHKFDVVYYEENVIGYLFLILKEFLVGYIIGFVVYSFFSIFYFVGQLVDFQIGFSMVSVFDPVSQTQVPITGNLYYFMICALFLISNGHHSFLRALIYSYDAVPLGGAVLIGNNGLVITFLHVVISFFLIGFKIAMPVVGAILVVDVSLGLLVKAAPQMHIFSVGVPIKLIIGLMIIYIILPLFLGVSNSVFSEINKSVFSTIKELMP